MVLGWLFSPTKKKSNQQYEGPSATNNNQQQQDVATTIDLHFLCGSSGGVAGSNTSGSYNPQSAVNLPVFRMIAQRLAQEHRLYFIEFSGRSTEGLSEKLYTSMYEEASPTAFAAQQSFSDTASFIDAPDDGAPRGYLGIMCFCPLLSTPDMDPQDGGITINSINSEINALSSDCPMVSKGARLVLTLPVSTNNVGTGESAAAAGGSVFGGGHGDGEALYSPDECDGGGPGQGLDSAVQVISYVPNTNKYALYEKARSVFEIAKARCSSGATMLMTGGGNNETEEMQTAPVTCVAKDSLELVRRKETMRALKAICKNVVTTEGTDDRFLQLMSGTGKFHEVVTQYPCATAVIDALGFQEPNDKGMRILSRDDARELLPEFRRTLRVIRDILPDE